MKSKVVGQIHDSLIGDVKIKELGDYSEIVEETTTVNLPKHYPWLTVSPEIEYGITPSNGSWHDKKEIVFKGGRFQHPTQETKWTRDAVKLIKTIDLMKEI